MTDQICVVEPIGVLDSARAKEFRDLIQSSITPETQIILIDFQGVSFMDSSGLGTLVLTLKAIKSNGISLYLCSINEQIKMLFELTSMDSFFQVYENKESFLNALAS